MLSIRELFDSQSNVRMLGTGVGSVTGVSTDTRTLKTGQLFVALRGENFDGNQMIVRALANGAKAALVDNEALARAASHHGATILVVDNAKAGLGLLAKNWRQRFTCPLIAVTGSNGKTTVKEMIASVLRQAFGAGAFATKGNLNNDIGVPLTLLDLNESVQVGVIELGMNHPGEIAFLADLTQPKIALVNNAQREHQEFMNSVEAVARENGEVLRSLNNDGVAIFPADASHSGIWFELARQRNQIVFSLYDTEQQAHAAEQQLAPNQRLVWAYSSAQPDGFDAMFFDATHGRKHTRLNLAIAGEHNVRNALAAAACVWALGVVSHDQIAKGLQAFRPVKGRLVSHQRIRSDNTRLTLVDDSYNANPDSVLAAIALLAQMPAPRCLVLGDMGEVGSQGPQFHEEVGLAALNASLDEVYLLGDLTKYCLRPFEENSSSVSQVQHFVHRDELVAQLLSSRCNSVLVKGSRFMAMDRIVDAVLADTKELH
jgi:UDP-N-acetylmuramoyl-tripeptide--D-alanyl-D-alanine ligase